MGALVELTQDNFETTIASGVTLVDFWAPWCGPCKSLGPILEDAATDIGDKAKIVKVNTDENIALAQKYGVSSIPFMVVFKDGEPVDQSVGVQPKANIIAMIEKQL